MVARRTEWLKSLTPEDVNSAESFAEYCQQTLGTPYPPLKNMIVLRKKINDFFEAKPYATWFTLCRVVQWARSKKKRPADAWRVVGMWKWAWQDGALPELDPGQEHDPELDDRIESALCQETDAEWRERLRVAETVQEKREVFRKWVTERRA